MKKHLLILIFALPIFIWQGAEAQQNEFAPIGATWYYSLADYSIPYPFTQLKYMKIVSVKDTIISNKSCRVLEEYRTNLNTPDNDLYFSKLHFVYSDSNKVFYFNSITENFEILYDFNKIQGEYWLSNSLGSSSECDTIRVENTGTMQINQVTLKTLNVSQQNCMAGFFHPNYQIVEVVGHLHYLFPQSDFPTEGALRCYEDSNIGLYNSDISPSCDYIGLVSTNEHKDENKIYISPIPCTEILNIQIQSINEKDINIKFLNINGQLVKSGILQNNGVGIFSINVSDLPKGIYILNIQSETRQFNKKVVIH